MDSVFVQGIVGFIAAIAVFVGGVGLLLALVLGARLAYFVTASITLGFVLIMGVVWSFGTPLGPVGDLPSWKDVAVGEDTSAVDFGPISQYPDGGEWRAADPDDQAETTKVAELEGDAVETLADAIEKKKVRGFVAPDDAIVNSDNTRLLEQDGTEYGAVTFEAAPPPTPAPTADAGDEGADEAEREDENVANVPSAGQPGAGEPQTDPDAQAVVVMQYDPGNPLGKARMITAGTAILFVAHLIGLSIMERRARRRGQA